MQKNKNFEKYFAAFFAVFLCTLLGKILDNFLIPIDQILIYLIGAVLLATRFGRRSSILFSFLSAVTFNFFFVEPLYSFNVADKTYWLTIFVMLATSLVIATQAAKLNQAEIEKTRNIFLSSISHDLRTPLASIAGASEGIITNYAKLKKDELLELVKSINEQAKRLTKIVTNLLDITSLESGSLRLNKQSYYIQEIIGSAILRLKEQLKNHQVEVVCDKDLPMVLIDGVLIEQVFFNLVENAAKYTPAQSKIKISARLQAKNLLLEISDNGLGINEEKKSQQGYGLGLIICKSIIKAHGSRLKIFNDNGAHFSFLLSELIFPKNL